MLYDLFCALFEAFKWLIFGIFGMSALGLVCVGIPAFRGQRRHVRYLRTREKMRAKKEFDAHLSTFYTKDSDDADFFSNIQKHLFREETETLSEDPPLLFDTSIDAVLRNEALKFLSGEHMIQDHPPTLFEETLGNTINNSGPFLGQDQPRLLRDQTMTFFKNVDGDTDGFQQLP